MEAVFLLVVAVFVGGLALLAQWGRKNQGAYIALVVLLLAVSVLVLAAGGIFAGIGLLTEAATADLGLASRFLFVTAGAVTLLVGVVGIGLCVPPLRRVTGRRTGSGWWADPPIFLSLWLLVAVLANSAVSLLLFTEAEDATQLFPTGRLSPADIVLGQLPFVLVALAGVGLGIRRSFRETVARLGYGSLSLPQLGVVVLFVAGALGLSRLADAVFAALQPGLYERVGEVSENLFDPTGLGAAQAVLFALLIGVGAGLGEETLFRGALQPRLGIVATSVLFASLHVQYGPSVLLVYIFVISVGFGLLRRHINTTASFLAHAAYNALAILLAYFLGV